MDYLTSKSAFIPFTAIKQEKISDTEVLQFGYLASIKELITISSSPSWVLIAPNTFPLNN